MAQDGDRVEVRLGVRDTTPGALSRWAAQFREALGSVGTAAQGSTRQLSLVERALASLPPAARRAGDGVAEALARVGRASDTALGGLSSLGKGLAGVFERLTSLRSLLAGYSAFKLGKDFLDVADSASRMRMALDQLTGGRGEEWFARLNEWAFKMPLNTEKGVEAFIRLRSFGLEPTIEQMTTLVDATIGVGRGEEALESVSRALGQIQAKGKLSAEELNQLAEAGIPAKQILADAFRLPVEELDRLMAKGIEAKGAVEALFAGLEARFGGASARMQKKFSGLADALVSHVRDFQRLLMESGPFQYIEETLARVVASLDDSRASGGLRRLAARLGESLVQALKGVVTWAENLAANWDRLGAKWEVLLGSARNFLATGSEAAGVVASLLETALRGWLALPAVIREVGLVGALIGGVKGKLIFAALVGLGALLDKARELPETKFALGDRQAAVDAFLQNWAAEHGGTAQPMGRSGPTLGEVRAKAAGLEGEPLQATLSAEDLAALGLGGAQARETPAFAPKVKQDPDKLREVNDYLREQALALAEAEAARQGYLERLEASEAKELAALDKRMAKAREDGALTAQAAEEFGALREGIHRKYDRQREEEAWKQANALVELERQSGLVSLQEYQNVLATRVERAREYYGEESQEYLQELAKRDQFLRESQRTELEVQLTVAKAHGDTRKVKELELRAYEQSLDRSRYTQEQIERLTAAKRVELNKSAFQTMLEDWADTGKQLASLGEESLRSIQGGFRDFFNDTVASGRVAWDTLWGAFKNIGANAVSQVLTMLSTSLLARGVSAVLPGFSGLAGSDKQAGQGGGTGILGNLGQLASGVKSLFGGTSTGGLGGMVVNAFGTPTYAAGELVGNSLWGMNAGAWNAAFGAAGLGALGGGLVAPLVWGDKGHAGTGGSIGGALGAGIGMAVGGPLGALAGGLIGGLGGGGIGSLFGGEDDTAEREADAKAYGELVEGIKAKTGDAYSWLEAMRRAHESDNRVGWQRMAQDYAELKEAGLLEWWQPDVARANEVRAAGGAGYEQKAFWQADTIKTMLAGGDWAGFGEDLAGRWEELAENPALDSLGAGLAAIQTVLEPLGLDLAKMTEGLDLATLGADQLAQALDERLNPATLIQGQLTADLEAGMTRLDAAKKAVTTTVDALLGTYSLSSEEQGQLIDLLLTQSGSVEDLTQKYERYQEIQGYLAEAHKYSRDEIEGWVAEGRGLRQELGLQDSAFETLKNALTGEGGLVESIDKLRSALEALPEEINIHTKYTSEGEPPKGGDSGDQQHHVGGLIRLHTGSLVSAVLGSGLLDGLGGRPGRLHEGGRPRWLAYDEVLRVLQMGEFVTRQRAVNPDTLPVLEQINRTGEPAYLPLPVSAPAPAAAPVRVESPAGGGQPQVIQPTVTVVLNGDVIGEAEMVERIKRGAARGAQVLMDRRLAAGELSPQAGATRLRRLF